MQPASGAPEAPVWSGDVRLFQLSLLGDVPKGPEGEATRGRLVKIIHFKADVDLYANRV